MPTLTGTNTVPTITRHRSTVEYIGYTFESVTVNGESVDPPDNYEMAATPTGTQPTTWYTAPWLAGPLTPGIYDLYLRFTDTPEVPVRRVARLSVE
jgi:hypothetical protein